MDVTEIFKKRIRKALLPRSLAFRVPLPHHCVALRLRHLHDFLPPPPSRTYHGRKTTEDQKFDFWPPPLFLHRVALRPIFHDIPIGYLHTKGIPPGFSAMGRFQMLTRVGFLNFSTWRTKRAKTAQWYMLGYPKTIIYKGIKKCHLCRNRRKWTKFHFKNFFLRGHWP